MNRAKKEVKKRRMLSLLISSLIYLIILCLAVAAPPPTPHNVAGKVFHSDGSTGVENGHIVRINNTNQSGVEVETQVNAPPVPFLAGSYSLTIDGNDNDTIIAYSWNASHYGVNSTNLSETTTDLNIVIQTLRDSETNVTILTPLDSETFNSGVVLNVSANVTIIGGQDGTGCSATLSFTNETILNITDDQTFTQALGAITLGDHVVVTWNVSADQVGFTNFTVTAECTSDDIIFDRVDRDTHTNIQVVDITPPVVTLISPANNSLVATTSPGFSYVQLTYNVTDASPIKNCSLIFGEEQNVTNTSVTRDTDQFFYVNVTEGSYNWSVQCTDNSSNENTASSGTFLFSVVGDQAPVVQNVAIADPINLALGSALTVECNATIFDANNISSISHVNATFFQESVGHFAPDDNNDHYTNESCFAYSNSTNEANYTCTFAVEYYANNGTWMCNVTTQDATSEAYSNRTTVVNELLAVEVTPTVLDYGVMQATNITEDDLNLTITNRGNVDFNISLEGFGEVEGDGLSLNCDSGTVPVANHRYAVNYSLPFTEMISLSTAETTVANLSFPQRTDDNGLGDSTNRTHWKVGLPAAISGNCNGSVIVRTVVI